MRKILYAGTVSLAIALGGQAFAADLPSTKGAPIFEPPMAVSWTGFYTGDQLGGVSAQGKWGNGVVGNNNTFGALGGEHLGYRRQFGAWVLGVQGQADMVGAAGTTNLSATTSLSLRQKWLYSADAQLGYAADRWMFYAIGGAAFTTAYGDYIVRAVDAKSTFTRTGFDIGAGAEYAISDHWSAFAEYRYYNFGRSNFAATVIGNTVVPPRSLAVTDNAVRVGASYRFNLESLFGEPVAAKF